MESYTYSTDGNPYLTSLDYVKGDSVDYTWIYDDAGNILSKNEYAYTTGTLGTATDTITYTYGDSEWGDLLTSYDGTTYTYDAIGNLTYC